MDIYNSSYLFSGWVSKIKIIIFLKTPSNSTKNVIPKLFKIIFSNF